MRTGITSCLAVAAGVALLSAFAACSDASSDTLQAYGRYGGGGEATGGTSSSGGASSPSGSSSGGGTSSSSGGGNSTLTDSGVADVGDGGAGRTLFEALLPSFEQECGGACHQNGGAGAPPYLGGTDPYTTIKTYTGMIANPATQSILLTKGQHEGPALPSALQASLTGWLTVEAAALAASGPPVTSPITVASGANTVDLSSLGIAGVSLTFTASIASGILTLNNIEIAAPTTTGIQLTWPMFFVDPTGAGAPVENDDFSNVSQTVAAGTSTTLGTGILILTGWATGDTMQVAFTTLAKASVADAGGGGCKAVATFQADAVPAIQANTCLNCHNTGGSGNASLDLSALALSTPDYATACAQALTRINTTTPAQSDIILAPTGQVANHPFTSASASFVTMMETWISAEK